MATSLISGGMLYYKTVLSQRLKTARSCWMPPQSKAWHSADQRHIIFWIGNCVQLEAILFGDMLKRGFINFISHSYCEVKSILWGRAEKKLEMSII